MQPPKSPAGSIFSWEKDGKRVAAFPEKLQQLKTGQAIHPLNPDSLIAHLTGELQLFAAAHVMHPAQKNDSWTRWNMWNWNELEPSGTPDLSTLKNHRVLLSQLVWARSQWVKRKR